jgi:16S rRNA (guanine527-N7)-methyltransferase
MGLRVLSPLEKDSLQAFIDLRAQWSRIHNLSGPDALRDPWAVDVADALALDQLCVPALTLVDVGSGSGVPGLMLGLLRSDLEIHLVEPSAKRAAFLRHASATLGLKHVQVQRARWPLPGLVAPVQVSARAVFPVPEWPAVAASGGKMVRTLYRHLAAERPPLGVPGFELTGSLDYPGPGVAGRRLERWSRIDGV